MRHPYVEPDYLVLNREEKKSITKTLLIFPVLCVCFLLLMCVGEVDATSSLPSFTKCKYFFTANRVVSEFCNGKTDNIMAHNLAYFDNGTLNYVYYSGVQDIYDGGSELLTEVYETFLEDELVISFVGMPYVQVQTHLNKFSSTTERSYVWHAIGYVFRGKQDIMQIDIQFISPEIYYVFVSPTLPELDDNASEEEQKALEEYKLSAEYTLLQRTKSYLSWVFNVASSQSEDTVKYIENVFDKHNISAPLINQFVTRYFTNEGNYLNRTFTEDIKTNYQLNFAWMLYTLAREVQIVESNISYGMYDKTTHAISMSMSFELKDWAGRKALLRIPILYTPAGYQIIDTQISCVADTYFESERLPQLISFLETEIAPDDVLIERAAFELNRK